MNENDDIGGTTMTPCEQLGLQGKPVDEVHHPQHYTDGEIECIDAIKAALSPEEYKGFLKGNAMKYIWRMNRKGKPSVDAKKALWYIDKLCGEIE